MNSRRATAICLGLSAGTAAVFLIVARGCKEEKLEEKISQPSLALPDRKSAGASSTPEVETVVPTMEAIVIRVASTGAGIVSIKEYAGEAKLQRTVEREGRLYYQLFDGEEKLVGEGSLADPWNLHYDAVASGTGGELIGGRIKRPTAEILVRIPSGTGAATIELTDYTESAEGVFLGKLSLQERR